MNLLSKLAQRRAEIALALASAIVSLLIAEAFLHLSLPPAYGLWKNGWSLQQNYSFLRNETDRPGVSSEVNVTYYANGFKRWGKPGAKRTKVLIIGDSYTQAVQVSNGEEWYQRLQDDFDAEFFVVGVGGYGSLQEYITLNETIDRIRPGIIIWQFTSNDYWNNLYDLDLYSYPDNNRGWRPYLQDGTIVYRMPMPLAALRERSRIADYLLREYDRSARLSSLSRNNQTDGPAVPGYLAKSKDVTAQIMSMVRKRAGETPIYLFIAYTPNQGRMEPQIDAMTREICAKTNITYVGGLQQYLENKTAGGQMLTVNNGHWNLAGNRYVGKYLSGYFRSHHILRKAKKPAASQTACPADTGCPA